MTIKLLVSASIALLGFAPLAMSATLDEVKSRGYLKCGVSTGLAGFSSPNDQGEWTGLDVDYCKALAAAVFGDSSKVRFTPLSAKDRFTSLQSRDIDVLSRNTTWTIDRDTNFGAAFAGVMYYDGQGFMVRKSLGVDSALKLAGASVCVLGGTATEVNLADYFKTHDMNYEAKTYENLDSVKTAYEQGACDVYTTDKSGLYSIRLTMSKPEDHDILPETISKEPLGPMVRRGDEQWLALAKWVYFVLLDAEELGVTSANVDDRRKDSTNPDVQRLLGVDVKFGEHLGVNNDWAYTIIKQVGNYGEMFDRSVGASSPLKIERGLNALWTNGGLQYGMPVK